MISKSGIQDPREVKGKVTEAKWTVPDGFRVMAVAGKTKVTGSGNNFTSTPIGNNEHTVKICFDLKSLNDGLKKKIKKECYVKKQFSVKATCKLEKEPKEAPDVRQVTKFRLFLAFLRKITICIRNVEKEGATDTKSDGEAKITKEYRDALKASYEKMWKGAACLEFEITTDANVELAAKHYTATDPMCFKGDRAANAALAEKNKKDCINVYVFKCLVNAQGNTPPAHPDAEDKSFAPPEFDFSAIADSQAPTTSTAPHELGHFFGWLLVITSVDGIKIPLWGELNVCRPSDKTKLGMLDNVGGRTDDRALSDANLAEMIKRICEFSKEIK